MTKHSSTEVLYDPRNGGKAIRIESLRFDGKPFGPARTNYFSLYLIESGSGTFSADASQRPDVLLTAADPQAVDA